jgi:hypothetical protein
MRAGRQCTDFLGIELEFHELGTGCRERNENGRFELSPRVQVRGINANA